MTRAGLINRKKQLEKELALVKKQIRETLDIGDRVYYTKMSSGLRPITVYGTIIDKVFKKNGELKYFTVKHATHYLGLEDTCNKSPASLNLTEDEEVY